MIFYALTSAGPEGGVEYFLRGPTDVNVTEKHV